MPKLTACRLTMIASLLFVTTGWSMNASAQSHNTANPNQAVYLLAATDNISLEQAVKQVKRETGGRILTAETVTRNGQSVHRIKVLLPNGNVKIVYVDIH